MRLRIRHTTLFTYDQPISEAYTEMRLAPRDGARQHRTAFDLVTEPQGEVFRYTDRHRNEIHFFDILQSHQQLKVTAASEVLTSDGDDLEPPELTPLDRHDWLTPTTYAPEGAVFAEIAASCAVDGNPEATALALMDKVHAALRYEIGATNVKTTADEALRLGRGVCQDYAHVMLAAARALGFPARYVSGYLGSRLAQESGNAASHAWIDLLIPGQGWMSVDPTHGCRQDARYVRIAVGRDYADVPPTRGTYKGSAKEHMEVFVTVEEARS